MENVNLWSSIGETLNEMLVRILNWTQELVATRAPGLLSALLVLALGWMLASLLRNGASKVLRAAGFDVVAERSGARAYLRRHDILTPPSVMAGWVLYLGILYTALVMACDRLQFVAGAQLLTHVAAFVPKLIVVLLLLGLGVWLARWIGALVERGARLAGVPFFALVGALARAGGIVVAMVVALDYLGLASHRMLLAVFGAVLLTVFVAAGLFAICARELVGNMLARNFVSGEFKPGDRIQIGDLEGAVESVGATVLRVRTSNGRHLVPHGRLVREVAVNLSAEATPPAAASPGAQP